MKTKKWEAKMKINLCINHTWAVVMISLCYALVINVNASDRTSKTPAIPAQVLGVDKSVELMSRDVWDIKSVQFANDVCNSATKDAIEDIVYGVNNHPRSDVIIGNYGLVADANDLKKMDQYFEDKNRVYDGKKIGAMACALKNMSDRKIVGSDEMLDKILRPVFWSERKIDIKSLAFMPFSDGNPECAMFMEVAFFKMKTGDPSKSDKIAAALDELPVGLRQKIASQTMIANYVYGVSRYRSLAENYVKNIQPQLDAKTKEYFQKQQNFINAKHKENEKRRAAQKITRERNNEYTRIYQDPKSRIVGEYNQETKKSLAKDADNFIEQVIKPYIKKPADKQLRNSLIISLADNGVPLFSDSNTTDTIDELFKKKPKFTNDLEQTQIMTRDLLEYKYDLANASIQSFSLSPLGPSSISKALKNPKLNADVVLVSISFKGAGRLKEKYPRHFSGGGGPFASQDSRGQPVIHLIYYREMNKWYWNPPGW